MSTLNGDCREEGTRPNSCAFSYFDATLVVPDTSKSGSWTLPHPDVTFTVHRLFPHGFTEARGCFCEDPIVKETPVTSGTIVLKQFATPPLSGAPASLELQNLGPDAPGATGGILAYTCP